MTARTKTAEAQVEALGTRERIMEVALKEFADKGLSGARVDDIADQVKTSKRMIYYHFGSKEGLYQAVLARAYEGIRQSEATVRTELLSPREALRTIVGVSFDYHNSHPMFVRLVMNENIHYAEHLDVATREANRGIIERLREILERGEQSGDFRAGLDARQLHLTISALGFHFVSNQHTFSKVFDWDMTSHEAVAARREIAIDTVLRWVSAAD
ncbi:TetR family transcriptional regulator [Phenylobacterium sp. J367]|uniref:TetR family transcriptional regulator n=1 Tax=Phenylobacterium sp. J367 TaxID=2898435 RepID=UPI002150F477|nr:TetR family transcriptional regulator [Phenylobacterium sp. J367]MCR5879287.1 TetR family transcriptional regulator [Phenylobacterium sp. J367]